MRLRTALLAVAVLSTPVRANDFHIEEEALARLPNAVEAAIRADVAFNDYRECQLIGKPVDLTGGGDHSGFVATTAHACGWGAALGPIWVVRQSGSSAKVVLSYGGYSLTLSKATSNGLRNTAISEGTASGYSESLWKFDGNTYVKVKERSGPPG